MTPSSLTFNDKKILHFWGLNNCVMNRKDDEFVDGSVFDWLVYQEVAPYTYCGSNLSLPPLQLLFESVSRRECRCTIIHESIWRTHTHAESSN